MDRVSSLVRSVLAARGWSVADAARAAKVRSSTIERILTGELPSVHIIHRIAVPLGVDVELLADAVQADRSARGSK